ncbi:unnamed protein product, partial [Clonostachys rhizophaga]
MVLRLYTRGLLTRAIGSEDWVLLAAVVSSTTLCGVIIYQVNKGLGLHSERVPMPDWVYLRLAGWLAILFSTISLHLTKVSILLLYARVFTNRSYRIAIYIIACRPIHGFWKPSSQTCLSSDYWIVSTVLHLGTDLIATILPLPILLMLNINQKEKIILVILFALGFLWAAQTRQRQFKANKSTESLLFRFFDCITHLRMHRLTIRSGPVSHRPTGLVSRSTWLLSARA